VDSVLLRLFEGDDSSFYVRIAVHAGELIADWSCPVCVDTGWVGFCLHVLCVTYWHTGSGSLVIPGTHLG
jgi:hypothetical protein